MPRASLGFHLAGTRVRMVSLTEGTGHPRLGGLGTVELGRAANLVLGTPEGTEELAARFRSLAPLCAGAPTSCAVGLGPGVFRLRRAAAETVGSVQAFAAHAEWEAGLLGGGTAEEFVADVFGMGSYVYAVTALRETVDAVGEVLALAALGAAIVDAEPLALANTWPVWPPGASEDVHVLVNLDAHGAHFSVWDRGVLGLAEGVLPRRPDGDQSTEAPMIVRSLERRVARRIRQLARSGNIPGEGLRLSRVWVSGEGAQDENIIGGLADGLSAPAEAYDPFAALVEARRLEVDQRMEVKEGPVFAVALGLALRALAEP